MRTLGTVRARRSLCSVLLVVMGTRAWCAAGESLESLLAGSTSAPAPASAPVGQRSCGMSFVENGGQWPLEAPFLAQTSEMLIRAGSKSLGLQVFDRGLQSRSGVLVDLSFIGACEDVLIEGLDLQAGLHHYYFGEDPSHWVHDRHAFGRLRYRELWRGIDLVLRDGLQGFEYDFELAPGAATESIRLRADGALGLAIDAEGNLVIATAHGPIYQATPRATQVTRDGAVVDVECRFVRGPGLEFGFEAPGRDPALPLVIDPVIYWATYVGGGVGPGGSGDALNAMDVDAQRNVYLTGWTESLDFPLTPGAYSYGSPTGGVRYMFVTKLAADGSSLVYSAWLSGGGDSRGMGIAADGHGQASVCGWTDGFFPTTPGAFDPVRSSYPASAGIVLRLDSTGSNLVYCTYLEGSGFCGQTIMNSLDVAASGAVVVGGQTSCMSSFPTTSGAFMPSSTLPALATLTRIDPTGSFLEWSTFFPAVPTIPALVVDQVDEVTFTGIVGALPFPITQGAFGQTLPSMSSPNIFVTRMNSTGSAVVWSTYVSIGKPYSIALDGSRGVALCGETVSTDFLTTPGAFQSRLNWVPGVGGRDGFVCRISPDASQLIYSTLIGGTWFDVAAKVDCASSGIVTVTTGPAGGDYPVTEGAYDTATTNSEQIGVTRFDPTGSKLYYSTFLGGPYWEGGGEISISPDGHTLIAGMTMGLFPVTPGAYDTSFNGGAYDLFAAELDLFPRGVRPHGNSTPASCAPGAVYLNATRMPKADDSRFGIYCSGAPRDRDGWLLFGAARSTPTNLLGAKLWLDPSQPITRRRIHSDHLGFLEENISLAAATAGTTFACQALFLNPLGCAATAPYSASNAVVVTLQP